nr:hypothetical protein [Tanacetum cinerariifolium]
MEDTFMEKVVLCGKKSPEKPTVELPREIIESDVLPRLYAVEFPCEIIESEVLPRLHVTVEFPHEIIESEVLPRLHPTVELLHEILECGLLSRLPAKSLGWMVTAIVGQRCLNVGGELWRMDGDGDRWTKVNDFPPVGNHPWTYDDEKIDIEDLPLNFILPINVNRLQCRRKILYLETPVLLLVMLLHILSLLPHSRMVLYLVHDDVPTVCILVIPTPHWDDVIVISSNEEYSSDEEYFSDDEKQQRK